MILTPLFDSRFEKLMGEIVLLKWMLGILIAGVISLDPQVVLLTPHRSLVVFVGWVKAIAETHQHIPTPSDAFRCALPILRGLQRDHAQDAAGLRVGQHEASFEQ